MKLKPINDLTGVYITNPSITKRSTTVNDINAELIHVPCTLCTRDTINYLTSETDTTRRGAWFKMESGELTVILILQAFMRGSLGQEFAEK